MERSAGWTTWRVFIEGLRDEYGFDRTHALYDQRRAFADNRRARLREKRARRSLPKWMRREMARTEGE